MGVDGVGVGVVGSPGVRHNAPVFKGSQGILCHGQPNPGFRAAEGTGGGVVHAVLSPDILHIGGPEVDGGRKRSIVASLRDGLRRQGQSFILKVHQIGGAADGNTNGVGQPQRRSVDIRTIGVIPLGDRVIQHGRVMGAGHTIVGDGVLIQAKQRFSLPFKKRGVADATPLVSGQTAGCIIPSRRRWPPTQ